MRYYLLAEASTAKKPKPSIEEYWKPGPVITKTIKQYRSRKTTMKTAKAFASIMEARDRAAFLRGMPRIYKTLGAI